MQVAIMQPYFFPYLGYYSLISRADRFVLLDDVQFIRHGWIERNRILKPVEGWQYVSVPLEKFSLGTKIRDTAIKNIEDWRAKMLRQLEHYKKKSPFYAAAMEVIREALALDTSSITHLNRHVLQVTCDYIGLKRDITVFSDMDLSIAPVTHAGEWALHITQALRGTTYINPTGGLEIFDRQQFDDAKIALEFLGNHLSPYGQRRDTFEPGLSIIDVMMFNSPEQIRTLLDDTYLVPASSPATSSETS